MTKNKSILITGTSRGVGKTLAEHYATKGHTVYGCSRNDPAVTGENYTHFRCDLGDEAAVMKMFSKIRKRAEGLDILVNNAGAPHSRLALLIDAVTAEKVLKDNFLSAFLATREALKIMTRAGHGRIINISSINVPLGSAGSVIYSAAKAAIESLSHGLMNEVGDKDITINTIGLSLFEGDGMAADLSDESIADKKNRLAKPVLLGVDEIVNAIDFFASEEARNITDQVLYFGGPR